MPYANPLIIPDTNAATYRGICVLVPDLPEYRAALLGSLAYLEQWTAWERDDEHNALKSASLWRVANATTRLNWELGCEGDEMAFDCELMKDCLIEIAKAISVNVTVNNSCGASGSDTFYCVSDDGTTIINPPPIGDAPPPPPTLPPGMEPVPIVEPGVGEPPTGWETWGEFDASACNAANAYVDYVIRSLRWIASFIESDLIQIATLVVSLFALLGGGLAGLFSRSTLVLMAELIYEILALEWLTDEIDDLAQWVEDNRQELVCSIYRKRGNVDEAVTDFIADFYREAAGIVSDIEESGGWLSYWYQLANLFFGGDLLHYFMNVESPSNPSFVDCSLCEAPLVQAWEPLLSGGYQGETVYAETANVDGHLAFSATVFKSSQYGGFNCFFLNPIADLQPFTSDISYTFSDNSMSNKAWFLNFYSTENGTGSVVQSVELGASGSFTMSGNHGSVKLIHDGTIYTQTAPLSFDCELTVEWGA